MTPSHVTWPDMDADYQARFEVIDIETISHSKNNNSGWEVVDSLYLSALGLALVFLFSSIFLLFPFPFLFTPLIIFTAHLPHIYYE